jgi:GTP-binding protein EngB required for normal cell division
MLGELVELSDASTRRRALQLVDRLRAGDLRVALVGEAKRGKSTFGNALLGADVLPSGVVPVTSLSTEVSAGPDAVAVRFLDGRVGWAAPSDLERYVSERRNPHNRMGVADVRVHLADALPHPRMVLVDTPGVGSVHEHNTQAAQEAFAAMDAAVFVLTADPPISASELMLLREVAQLAVRVFVVLNKADQLNRQKELPEAVEFVTGVVSEALGERPELWVCSARQGLQARMSGDERAWRSSGMADFEEALLAFLVGHREQALHASVGLAAQRLAGQRLDAVNVTLATMQAFQADERDRLMEFADRLDAIDQRQVEAGEFLAAHLRADERRLEEDAALQVGRVRAQVQVQLDEFLHEAAKLEPREVEARGRSVIAEATLGAVETWRAEWHSRCRESYGQLVERQRHLLDEASGDLRLAAQDLLGVQLRSQVPTLVDPELPDLHYDFDPEVGWNQALVTGVRSFGPGRSVRRRVERYLRSEAARLADKHVGRAGADFRRLLQEAGRQLGRHVASAFGELTEGLREGQRAAMDLRQRDEAGRDAQLKRLVENRDRLSALVELLGHSADLQDASGSTTQPDSRSEA